MLTSACRNSLARPGRRPFRGHDTRGYVVRDALVYLIGLPYGWLRRAPETRTDGEGWATIQLQPTANLPLRRGALVMLVRVRSTWP